MADDKPDDPEEKRRSEEAASIFQRLDENPDDSQAQKDRDAFLARGEAERATYQRLLRFLGTVQNARKPKPNNTLKILIFIVLSLGSTLYLIFEPASIYLTADNITGNETEIVTLASGDVIILDGSSAINEEVDEKVRQVKLLRGAAYFDVRRDARPFIVDVEGLKVTVRGTQFEISKLSNEIVVSVADGYVEITVDDQTLSLQAGERVRLSEASAPVLDRTSIANIGSWRNDVLVTESMTLGEVIQIIDRRLPGPIFVVGENLASKTFRGRLDLSAPLIALQALAVTTDTTVRSASPIATIVSER